MAITLDFSLILGAKVGLSGVAFAFKRFSVAIFYASGDVDDLSWRGGIRFKAGDFFLCVIGAREIGIEISEVEQSRPLSSG